MGMRAALLDWYQPRGSVYPWRTTPADPYKVLVSEVMLQQTQASRVVIAFNAFISRFPTIESLAVAPRAAVLRTWSGLGYNRRALALSDAARVVMVEHEGQIPGDPEALVRLRGVGPYTAAAVASIGFGVPVSAIDTNVRRVVSRALLGAEPDSSRSREVNRAADRWLDRRDPGGWNQAVMDLGREVCRPAPRCDACPLGRWCAFRKNGGRRPVARPNRQPAYRGSSREVRGAVMRALLQRSPATLAYLVRTTGFERERVGRAVIGLNGDGLLVATAAALAGSSTGRARLPD
jgi:A/G-specific adenine glycosylase